MQSIVWYTQLGPLVRKSAVIRYLQDYRSAAAVHAASASCTRQVNAKETEWADQNERVFDIFSLTVSGSAMALVHHFRDRGISAGNGRASLLAL